MGLEGLFWLATPAGKIFLLVFVVFSLAVYVYKALAYMKIAKKLKHPYPWLAWIPIANVALIFQLGDMPWWLVFGFLVGMIPFIGGILGVIASIALAVVMVIALYKMCEKLNKPGWWGILIALIPIVNLIIIGILAWGEE